MGSQHLRAGDAPSFERLLRIGGREKGEKGEKQGKTRANRPFKPLNTMDVDVPSQWRRNSHAQEVPTRSALIERRRAELRPSADGVRAAAAREAAARERERAKDRGWFAPKGAEGGGPTRSKLLRNRRRAAVDEMRAKEAARARPEAVAEPRDAAAEAREAERRRAAGERARGRAARRAEEERVRAGLAAKTTDLYPDKPATLPLTYNAAPRYALASEMKAAQRRELAESNRRAAEEARRLGRLTAQQAKELAAARRAEEDAARPCAGRTASSVREGRRRDLRAAGQRMGEEIARQARHEPVFEGLDRPFHEVLRGGDEGSRRRRSVADDEEGSRFPPGQRTLMASRRTHSRLAGKVTDEPAGARPPASVGGGSGVWRPRRSSYTTSRLDFNKSMADAPASAADRPPSVMDEIEARKPLYSSFNADGVFREPVYVKASRPRSRLCSGALAEAQRRALRAARGEPDY